MTQQPGRVEQTKRDEAGERDVSVGGVEEGGVAAEEGLELSLIQPRARAHREQQSPKPRRRELWRDPRWRRHDAREQAPTPTGL